MVAVLNGGGKYDISVLIGMFLEIRVCYTDFFSFFFLDAFC